MSQFPETVKIGGVEKKKKEGDGEGPKRQRDGELLLCGDLL
jgi:hypothetical protein